LIYFGILKRKLLKPQL